MFLPADPSLTHKNVSTVTATVKLKNHELGMRILDVPFSKRDEIHQLSSTTYQERERLICYFINYSEYASWSDLAGRLYYREHHEALSAVKRFIKRTIGKCKCECVCVCVCVCVCGDSPYVAVYRLY